MKLGINEHQCGAGCWKAACWPNFVLLSSEKKVKTSQGEKKLMMDKRRRCLWRCPLAAPPIKLVSSTEISSQESRSSERLPSSVFEGDAVSSRVVCQKTTVTWGGLILVEAAGVARLTHQGHQMYSAGVQMCLVSPADRESDNTLAGALSGTHKQTCDPFLGTRTREAQARL